MRIRGKVTDIVTGMSCAAMLGCVLMRSASAADTYEQILERCRSSVTPQVQSCMQSRKGTGDRESNLAACREPVKAIVRACVQREGQRAAAGKAAPVTPKGDAGSASKEPIAIQAVFVAPPRSIADITEILDKERPDSTKLDKLRAAADLVPPQGVPDTTLAQFYNDRGNARALLARNTEAVADGLKALEIGKGSIPARQTVRLRQFVSLQYLALGIPSRLWRRFSSPCETGHSRACRAA